LKEPLFDGFAENFHKYIFLRVVIKILFTSKPPSHISHSKPKKLTLLKIYKRFYRRQYKAFETPFFQRSVKNSLKFFLVWHYRFYRQQKKHCNRAFKICALQKLEIKCRKSWKYINGSGEVRLTIYELFDIMIVKLCHLLIQNIAFSYHLC
jgi:hypothetical protein